VTEPSADIPIALRPLRSERFVVALLAIVLVGILVGGAILLAAKRTFRTLGEPVTDAERSEIASASCAKLGQLDAMYWDGFDGAYNPGATAWPIVNERMKALGCPSAHTPFSP